MPKAPRITGPNLAREHQMLKDKMKQENFDRLKYYEENNEYLRAKSLHVKDTTSALLKHMRQSQQSKNSHVKHMMRSGDPFSRWDQMGSSFDVMFPLGPGKASFRYLFIKL